MAGRHAGPSPPGPRPPGQLVVPAGTRTTVQFARGSWSTHGPSDPGPCRTAQLVDTEDPRAWALGVRDSWSTARSLRTGPESPGIAGRPHGTSGSSPRRLGQLVDRGSPDPCAGRPGQLFDTRALGYGPSHPGQLVDSAGPREWPRVPKGQLGDTTGTRSRAGVSWGSSSTPRACLRTQARVSRDSWWTPRALGQGLDSHGTVSRPLRPSDPGPRPPGQPVDPAGARSLADVARDIWSPPRALGHGPGSPGTAGQPQDLGPEPEWAGRYSGHCGPLGTGPSRLGSVIDPAIPRAGPETPGTAG